MSEDAIGSRGPDDRDTAPLAPEVAADVFADLRGASPTAALERFAVGVDDILAELEAELGRVQRGHGAVRFLRGDYGAGKTLVARLVQERARRAGFVTSWLVMSETELRFWKADEVYHAICERLCTPALPVGALIDIIAQWTSRLEILVRDGGLAPEDPRFGAAMGRRIEAELHAGHAGGLPLMMGAALRALYHARTRGDREAITGLLAWLQGSRNVDNAVKRQAGIKGDVSARDASEFLRGLVTIARLAGYRGLVVAIDEFETILRAPSNTRMRTYDAVRQLIELADDLPHVLWIITGTGPLFEDDAGFASLDPLHQRVRLLTQGDLVSLRQPQIQLPRLDRSELQLLGRRVAADYPWTSRVRSLDEMSPWMDQLVSNLVDGPDQREDRAPRQFLRRLVHVLDTLDEHPDHDPLPALQDQAAPPQEDASVWDAQDGPLTITS